MRTFALAALSAVILTGAGFSAATAVAADRAEARLAAPVSAPREVIIDGRLWKCAGQKCTAGSQGKNQPILRECSRAAKVLGPIVDYRQGTRMLSSGALATCNAPAETASTATGPDAAAVAK